MFSDQWLEPLAKVLQQLGSEHVLVVHAEDGLDEISIGAPTHVVELHEGDSVEAEITPTGEIRLKADRRFDKAAFLDRVRKLHENIPMTEPVVEQIRHEARY